MTTKQYTYGDDLLSQQYQGESHAYLYDGLGSTRALADSAGTITDEYFYEAFGELLASTGSTDNSYRFTGEQYDSALDQYYLRARYYDQSVGRFTQQDTWMGNNSDPITLHKYLYANVDPVNNTDPTGNFSIGGFFGVSFNIAGTLSTVAASALVADGLFGFGQSSAHGRGFFYHEYTTDRITICTKQEISWCTAEEVWNWMRLMPAPRAMSTSFLSAPLNDGDSTCCIGGALPMMFGGQITVEVGRYYVNNVTTALHTLAYGRVDRKVVDGGGTIYIDTLGSGENRLAFIAWMNDRIGGKISNAHDQQIRRQILSGRAGDIW